MINVIGNTIQSGGRALGPEKRNLVQHIIANRLAIDYDRAGQRDGIVQPGRCYKFEGGQGIDTKVQLPLADDFELSFDFVMEALPESGFEEDPISQYGGGAGRAMFRLRDSGMCFFINGSDGLRLPVILGFNKAMLVRTANVFSFTLNNNTDNLVYSGTIEDTTLVFGQRVLEETTYCFHGLLGNIVLKDANGDLLHHWQCNESTGDTCYDSVAEWEGPELVTNMYCDKYGNNLVTVNEGLFRVDYVDNQYGYLTGHFTQAGILSEDLDPNKEYVLTFKYRANRKFGIVIFDAHATSQFSTKNSPDDFVEFKYVRKYSSPRYLHLLSMQEGDFFEMKDFSITELHQPAHGQILNATPAFHAVDNRFANLQNIHGYSEKENLVKDSEDFTTARWQPFFTAPSKEYGYEAPDGKKSATKLTFANTEYSGLFQEYRNGPEELTTKVFLKSLSGEQTIKFGLDDGATAKVIVGPTWKEYEYSGISSVARGRSFELYKTPAYGGEILIWHPSTTFTATQDKSYVKTNDLAIERRLQPIQLDNQGNPTGKDVFGGIPTHRGKVRLKPSLTKNACGVFDGNAYCEIENYPKIDFEPHVDEVEISGYFKYESGSRIFSLNTGAKRKIQIAVASEGTEIGSMFIRICDEITIGVKKVNDNKWHHFRLYVPAASIGAKLYIDGEIEINNGAIGDPFGYATTAAIGKEIGFPSIYNLTGNIAYINFCKYINGVKTNVARYDFTLGHGDVIPDRVPTNPAHATLINAGPTFWGTDNDAPATNLLEGHSLAAVSDGVADYIDTGVVPDENTEIVIKGVFRGSTKASIAGSRNGWVDGSMFYFGLNVSGWHSYYGDSLYSSSIANDNLPHVFKLNKEGFYLDGSAIVAHSNTLSAVPLYPIYLFGFNRGDISGPDELSEIDLYYAKIIQNGVLIRHFIPLPDGTLLDIVNNVTYVNGAGKPLGVKRIPAQVGNTGKDIYDQPLTNPAGYHNGAETCIHQPECPDLNMEPWAIDNVFQDVPFEDLPENSGDQIMNDSSKPGVKKNQLTYSEPLEGASLTRTKKYLKQ